MRSSPLFLAVALCSQTACNREKPTTDPSAGSNLLGPNIAKVESTEEGVGSIEGADEEGVDELMAGSEEPDPEAAKAAKLPPRAAPVERCTGKGKKRVCKEVDPKPKVSAAHGVAALMGDYRWGMSPTQVFRLLARDVEKEYEERLAKARGPMEQDAAGRWRREQTNAIRANHVAFTKQANHRWGVSLVQFEYEDDNNEEMIWNRNAAGLWKFYFFKDDELWKVVYAYSPESFPGKSYEDVVEEKFKKWFGPSPEAKVKQDPKTAAPLVRYFEWKALNGEIVRSFDMTTVHGVLVLAVIDGKAEARIGERLPSFKKEEGVVDVVGDVLGGSDVCYDKSGNIEQCKKD